jgi:N-acyl-L-homoserine lactone synthetase
VLSREALMKTVILDRHNRSELAHLYTAMFRQRAILFAEVLKWDNMSVVNGEERDDADSDPNVEYLVTVDDAGELVGSCRLTPSLGKCLLAGPLAFYLNEPLPRTEKIWEFTRFAPSTYPDSPLNGQSFVGLGVGVLEWGLMRGVDKLYGIAEPSLLGIAGSLGAKISLEGPPVEFQPGKKAFAFSYPIDDETLDFARKSLKLKGSVMGSLVTSTEVAA